MSEVFDEQTPQTLRHVRIDTLVRLRWLAVLGQTAAVLVVYDGFDLEVPFWACLAVIAVYASVNVALRLLFRWNQRLEPHQAARLLALDIVELAVLLFLTGGLQNPFSFLMAGPVLISAAALPKRMTLILGGLGFICATILVRFYYPLPWPEEEAIELVLTREHYLTQLDGLAAAAAHELGTPLSTILVVARELEREIKPDSRFAEDIRLLREQAQRCRVILGKLTELPAPGEPFERMKLSALIEEVVAPNRGAGVAIEVEIAKDDPRETVGARNPAVLYGLGNILENAVDFARERVQVTAAWTDDKVVVEVNDDGSGFPPEIIDSMGEPYVTSERGRRMRGREMPGLGLGFFIAKTPLARSGAKISLKNKAFPQRGAIVRVRWKRADFERPLISELPDGTMLDAEEADKNDAASKHSGAPGPGGADKSEAPPLAEIH